MIQQKNRFNRWKRFSLRSSYMARRCLFCQRLECECGRTDAFAVTADHIALID